MRAPRVLQAGFDGRENGDRKNARGERLLAFPEKRIDRVTMDARHRSHRDALLFIMDKEWINQVPRQQMRLRHEPADGSRLAQAPRTNG